MIYCMWGRVGSDGCPFEANVVYRGNSYCAEHFAEVVRREDAHFKLKIDEISQRAAIGRQMARAFADHLYDHPEAARPAAQPIPWWRRWFSPEGT